MTRGQSQEKDPNNSNIIFVHIMLDRQYLSLEIKPYKLLGKCTILPSEEYIISNN